MNKNLNEAKIFVPHNWVQSNLLDDVCTKCGEMAYGTIGGIVYPETTCLGKPQEKVMKNVRALAHAGFYSNRPIQDSEFKKDVCEWIGSFEGAEEAFDKYAARCCSVDELLDAMCDFANNSLLM